MRKSLTRGIACRGSWPTGAATGPVGGGAFGLGRQSAGENARRGKRTRARAARRLRKRTPCATAPGACQRPGEHDRSPERAPAHGARRFYSRLQCAGGGERPERIDRSCARGQRHRRPAPTGSHRWGDSASVRPAPRHRGRHRLRQHRADFRSGTHHWRDCLLRAANA